MDVDDVEAVEEILAEGALADALPQIAMGGADHADVDARHLPVGADLLDLAGLEEAEQQGLHPQRHLADFVEEDGAAVGHLQQARPVAVRVGEAALDVAEQLGFEQRIGQAGAVDRDERLAGPGAAAVDQAGRDVLADAALAGDEHLGIGAAGRGDVIVEGTGCRARADERGGSLGVGDGHRVRPTLPKRRAAAGLSCGAAEPPLRGTARNPRVAARRRDRGGRNAPCTWCRGRKRRAETRYDGVPSRSPIGHGHSFRFDADSRGRGPLRTDGAGGGQGDPRAHADFLRRARGDGQRSRRAAHQVRARRGRGGRGQSGGTGRAWSRPR